MQRAACAEDKGALIKLYKKCFNDSTDFVSAVFDFVWKPSETLVREEEGQIISMVLLPRFNLQKSGVNCGYIYALCTDPAHQNKGAMTKLLNYAHLYCERRGDDFTMLVPASQTLFCLYAKFSYKPGFYIKKSVFRADKSDCALKKACLSDFEFINTLYESRFSAGEHIKRDCALFSALDAIYGADGGGFFVGESGYVLIEKNPDRITVREACPTRGISQLLSQAAFTFGTQELFCRLPSQSGEPHGCIRTISGTSPEKPVLFNLLFD